MPTLILEADRACSRGRALRGRPGIALALTVLTALAALPLRGVTVDRIAAVVDRQVITVSEVSQMVEIRFFPRRAEEEDAHRREVLEALIAQVLRFRDAERFGSRDVAPETIEERLAEIQGRFPTPEAFEAAVARAQLTPDDIRALAQRQLQVEAYIAERFAPLVFVSAEELEAHYRGPWSEQQKALGRPIPPLADVRDSIRAAVRSTRLAEEIDRWTAQLRARANVDVYAWR